MHVERDLEIALVARLRAGDTVAFDIIHDAFNRPLLNFLTRLARNRTVAEDLVEETWLRLVSGSGELDADTRLGPWLFTVARNLFVSYCRSRAREDAYTGELTLLWPAELPRTPYDIAAMKQQEARLEAAIESLPPLYREVLLLVGVEQMRPMDAARVCGISPESLRQRLSRARAMISKLLPGWGKVREVGRD